MKKIEAIIIADSVHKGSRITTFLLTYPRMIHAELMTHRVFSRNSASSRAIPFKKMVDSVKEDPFIPIAWQKEHTGMQGTEYFTDPLEIGDRRLYWKECAIEACNNAENLNSLGVTKQLCNRILEPFLWHTVLVTTTELENFFGLRCPEYTVAWYPADRPEALEPSEADFRSKKDAIKATGNETHDWTLIDWLKSSTSSAEIHIQALAEAMWDAYKESVPRELETGQWHVPFGDKIELPSPIPIEAGLSLEEGVARRKAMIATARAARLSYMTMDGKIDYDKDIMLHNRLLEDGHMSPFEHCAKAMSLYAPIEVVEGATHQDKQGNIWSGNFKGWIQYRQLIREQQEDESN